MMETEHAPEFDIQTKLQELSSCADEDTFQDVLNSLKYKEWMLWMDGQNGFFLNLSADKDTVIKNIIRRCVVYYHVWKK